MQKLRNVENYSLDSENINPSSTGIRENSVWNSLQNFHVVQNYSVNIMHDLLEGVCIYDLKIIFNKFILEKKVIYNSGHKS